MEAGPQLLAQAWLPGLEPRAPGSTLAKPGTRRSARSTPRPPTFEKLLDKAAVKVRKLCGALRSELLREPGMAEHIHYDESAGAFAPAYAFQDREVLRLHLDPVLAATVTLERGERLLGQLLVSPNLPEKLKTQA